ncbi:4-fold beta flower protein [uncultured Psychrosphaera sp.]|uniref:4-fold beta flower protein n=1 Tax=uncultured Psychrosphaera sp. TaxID=1403522 RepID=UPI00262155F5|nr:hypothetical protein [uncultured Psychrosphaera sp.]
MHKQVYDASGKHTGIFDGEYVYNLSGQVVLRVDEDEIYNMEMPCKYVGVFEGVQATDLKGAVLFRLED